MSLCGRWRITSWKFTTPSIKLAGEEKTHLVAVLLWGNASAENSSQCKKKRHLNDIKQEIEAAGRVWHPPAPLWPSHSHSDWKKYFCLKIAHSSQSSTKRCYTFVEHQRTWLHITHTSLTWSKPASDASGDPSGAWQYSSTEEPVDSRLTSAPGSACQQHGQQHSQTNGHNCYINLTINTKKSYNCILVSH